MPWIAMKEQIVQRDGKKVVVKPGDEIPEAEFWPNRKAWERQKFIKYIERTEKQKRKKVEVKIKEDKKETEVKKEAGGSSPKTETKTKSKSKKKKKK